MGESVSINVLGKPVKSRVLEIWVMYFRKLEKRIVGCVLGNVLGNEINCCGQIQVRIIY